ncbi:terminase gpP N-terminus-related DNA-binding protein [Paenibacillus terrae]|uniref:terminase gpP N-terminus-related DNA-binding protein n=1 Tax=Paenibacillus terrae TaxID=159743 RepID=UPI001656879F|nr:helix-turn-helix domain-containing protein [Paenibacillus terrae]
MENSESFQEIQMAMKQAKKRRMYERYQTLYLYLQGTGVEQIAHTINRSAKTIKGYIKAYETDMHLRNSFNFVRTPKSSDTTIFYAK